VVPATTQAEAMQLIKRMQRKLRPCASPTLPEGGPQAVFR
jgi:hypothetical protein